MMRLFQRVCEPLLALPDIGCAGIVGATIDGQSQCCLWCAGGRADELPHQDFRRSRTYIPGPEKDWD
jgi:hypothetical protein